MFDVTFTCHSDNVIFVSGLYFYNICYAEHYMLYMLLLHTRYAVVGTKWLAYGLDKFGSLFISGLFGD